MQLSKILPWSFFVAGLLVAAGCGSKSNAPMQMPPTEVGVITIGTEAIPMTSELPGRIDSERVAQVRARATGILLKRLFVEGSEVKEGDVLFQIDPAPLKAAYDSAKASVDKARANLADAEIKSERYKSLEAINAISKQDYDDAHAAASQASADLATAKANLETASINLGYATVTAPISGKIGEAIATEGAYVTESQANELAVIQQMDPIYFDFTQSSTDVLKLKAAIDQGKLEKMDNDDVKVTLLLDDGTTYALAGKLLFRDITVDPSTGMVTLRAEFPNPDSTLLPGMFARVKFAEAVNQNAVTVLQRAVTLNGDGTATVMVVTADNKADVRSLKLGDAIDDKWIVNDGLKPGDVVIVEGLQKVRPGAPVKTVPYQSS